LINWKHKFPTRAAKKCYRKTKISTAQKKIATGKEKGVTEIELRVTSLLNI
jgi:hypothetical protein